MVVSDIEFLTCLLSAGYMVYVFYVFSRGIDLFLPSVMQRCSKRVPKLLLCP